MAVIDLLEEERFEEALTELDAALARSPKNPELLHLRAEALAGLGKVDEANEAFAAALAVAPHDVDLLRSAVEFLLVDLPDDRDALEEAVVLAERGLKHARKQKDRDLELDFLFLLGRAHNEQEGHARAALAALDAAHAIEPDDVQIELERGRALFELCRYDDARAQFARVLELDRTEAWADWYLALLDERRGDFKAADRRMGQARKKRPDEFGRPVMLSREEFDKAVEDGIEKLPPRARRWMRNVTIEVQHVPDHDDLVANDPPLSPMSLGMFRGTAITQRSTQDPWSEFPSAIILYQRNLERFARTRDELVEEIGVTLLHEVGHFLGLSEEDLYARGLD